MSKVLICGAVRTPIGVLGGGLSSVLARDLVAFVTKNALAQSKIDPKSIEYTSCGWVVQDPRPFNIGRSGCELGGTPPVPGTTLHEQCSSGGASMAYIARMIKLGEIEAGVACGVEAMSNIARYMYAGRTKGQQYGDIPLVDGLQQSLFDPHVGKKGELMGLLTERLNDKYSLTRKELDEVAYRSHHNALKAWKDGMFTSDYVIPVPVPDPKKKGQTINFSKDENPRPVTMEELSAAKPYFKPDGMITGMNSSSVNDAAACVILCSEKLAKAQGLKVLGELRAYSAVGCLKEYMGEGAFLSIPKLLSRSEGFPTKFGPPIALKDVDFFEMNEAFAAVVAAGFKFFKGELPVEKVNQWGSGVGLGHPVGCTGVRQVVDMVHQLKKRGKHIGVTSRCAGGGIGSAELVLVE